MINVLLMCEQIIAFIFHSNYITIIFERKRKNIGKRLSKSLASVLSFSNLGLSGHPLN